MKNIVKVIALVLMCFSINASFAQAKRKADQQTEQWRYEVENLGQKSSRGGHGTTHILKVWSFSKKPEVAEEQSKKNAVHAVVFQGVPSNEEKRLNGIEPLLQDPAAEAENAQFLENFFATGGDYMRFVTITNGGMADAVRQGKEYKIGLTVEVNTPGLRKYLEEHNIITSLNAGFDKAKKPSIMVVPSRNWCERNDCMDKVEVMGEIISIPNYRKAFDMSTDLNNVTAKIGNMMTDRGFDLRLMSSVLTSIQNESAESAVLTSETSGAMMAESPIDKMRRVAKADIWLEVDWQLNVNGMDRSVTFNLSGIDAYTNEQIANCQGTGQPSYSKEIAVLMGEAVSNNIDNLNEQLSGKFEEWFVQGRAITVQLARFETCEYNFESEFDGEELGILIEDYMSEITVNGQFSTDIATANKMMFTNVRIPLFDKNDRAMDARRFGSMIRRYLSSEFQITSKVDIKGLGQVTIIIGEK